MNVTREAFDALERQALGWRALAIIAASGHPEIVPMIRQRLLMWTFRPADPEDIHNLLEQAKKAGTDLGLFQDSPEGCA